MNETEISIDVVEMIEFKGLVRFLITNVTKEGENKTLFLNEIGFPPTLFKDALSDKLASGGSKENLLIFSGMHEVPFKIKVFIRYLKKRMSVVKKVNKYNKDKEKLNVRFNVTLTPID